MRFFKPKRRQDAENVGTWLNLVTFEFAAGTKRILIDLDNCHDLLLTA